MIAICCDNQLSHRTTRARSQLPQCMMINHADVSGCKVLEHNTKEHAAARPAAAAAAAEAPLVAAAAAAAPFEAAAAALDSPAAAVAAALPRDAAVAAWHAGIVERLTESVTHCT